MVVVVVMIVIVIVMVMVKVEVDEEEEKREEEREGKEGEEGDAKLKWLGCRVGSRWSRGKLKLWDGAGYPRHLHILCPRKSMSRQVVARAPKTLSLAVTVTSRTTSRTPSTTTKNNPPLGNPETRTNITRQPSRVEKPLARSKPVMTAKQRSQQLLLIAHHKASSRNLLM